MTNNLTTQQIDKLGNSIIYLSHKVGELSKTKILKLLFLLEEASYKKYGHPFFGVNFELWVRGPVLKDVFIDLSDESPTLLKNFIKKVTADNRFYEAAKEFSDDEFSDNDIALLDAVAQFARHKIAANLVAHTHEVDSLWRQSAIKYGVLEELEKESVTSTNYTIDFGLLFGDNNFMKERYENSLENQEFINHHKG